MTDNRMRRSTAVGQVERMVDAASDIHRLSEHGFDIPLLEVWVGGAILQPVDRIDSYDVALVLDAPSDEVTWRAPDPTGDWIADRMRLTKMPVAWFVAPAGRPVHDRYHDRDWRRARTSRDVHPEDHLWRAAQAVRELTDAVDNHRTGDR
jgi:hypothetical protein